MAKSSIPSDDTASTSPITPCFRQASEKARRSLIRPEPVSQCAIIAHFGLFAASAASIATAPTDWPCGTVMVVTFAGCGSIGFAARSARLAAFIRRLSPSMPLKVPLTKTTTSSPGSTAEIRQSSPLNPVPATPKV